jgi:hypothetical protein
LQFRNKICTFVLQHFDFVFSFYYNTKLLKISDMAKLLCCFFIENQTFGELPKVEWFIIH